MNKKIKLTDPIVDDIAFYLGREHLTPGRPGVTTYPPRADTMDAWRIVTAVLSHPDAAGLFECDYTDYVHVDEAAARVEAAREQGWDDAAQHIYNKGWEGVGALRKANPHRPARELPTEGGIVIVANDGHDDIEAIGPVSGATWRTKEAVLGADGRWYGVWRLDARTPAAASVAPEHITLDTCKVDDR